MASSIEAALIAAVVSLISLAGTVIVAVSGFRNTRRLNKDNIAATVDDALRDRLFHKQAAVYERVIKDLLWQGAERTHQLNSLRTGAALRRVNPPVGWAELTARVSVYGSPEVVSAVTASTDARESVGAYYESSSRLPVQDRGPAVDHMRGLIAVAEVRDKEVIDAIRADVRNQPLSTLPRLAEQDVMEVERDAAYFGRAANFGRVVDDDDL